MMRRMMKIAVAAVFAWALASSMAFAADTVEDIERTATAETDVVKRALLYKKAGDYYSERGGYAASSGHYLNALSLSRESFTMDERLRMAIFVSWGGRFKEAGEELRLIIALSSAPTGAGVHLARVLAWQRRFDEAIVEIEKVLDKEPSNVEALIVKADTLRWKGELKGATALYEEILGKEENFGAHTGLAYALILSGDRKGAAEVMKKLKPVGPAEEEDVRKLRAAYAVAGPVLNVRYGRYEDSDDNSTDTYSLSSVFPAASWKVGVLFTHTAAKDNVRSNDADAISFDAYRQAERSGLGVGAGLFRSNAAKDSTTVTYQVKADAVLSGTRTGAHVSRSQISDTALLIENGIKVTNAGFYISPELSEKLSLTASYDYNDYSDDNRSHGFELSPGYAVYTANPRLTIAYRLKHLQFKRQSNGGYFDPDRFISNEIMLSLFFEKNRFYATIEPSVGYETFKRYGRSNNDIFSAGAATAGYKITERAAIELKGEIGDSAAAGAAGFRYNIIRMELIFRP